jgi:serine palmitoyltransferase
MTLLGPLQDDKKLLRKYDSGPYFEKSHNNNITRKCLNLGSYNYLGFADDWQATCACSVKASLVDFPVSASSACSAYGTTVLHRTLEQTVAEFIGKEDAVVFTMGFNTNATTIPALVSKGDLIVSDELSQWRTLVRGGYPHISP